MTIPTIPCPCCQGKGNVPYPNVPSEHGCTTRCPLCWGLGNVPALEVVANGQTAVALHYWLCNCQEMQDRIHPSNHDICLACDLTEDEARLAPVEDVQAFFQSSYDVWLELFDITSFP